MMNIKAVIFRQRGNGGKKTNGNRTGYLKMSEHWRNDHQKRPFWETKRLDEMTREQWESLCDGCARCCLIQFEDEDSGELRHTDVVCRFLDQDRCRCTQYARRSVVKPGCMTLQPGRMDRYLYWMPRTCAYRLLAEGKPLFSWHPLVSGNPDSVHEAGVSVRGQVIPEQWVEDPWERLVSWLDE